MSPELDFSCVKIEKYIRKLNFRSEELFKKFKNLFRRDKKFPSEILKNTDLLRASHFPICLNATIRSSVKVLEEQFEAAVMDLAANKEDCQFIRNESSIKCFMQTPKNRMSLLRLGDYWIQFHRRNELQSVDKLGNLIFLYKTANFFLLLF